MKSSFLLACLLSTLLSFAQTNFGKRWIIAPYGYNIGFGTTIDHDTTYVIADHFFSRGHSCISDSSGLLRISSDGMDIFDGMFNLMDNGDSIVPKLIYQACQGFSRSPQASVILPVENRKYYVLTPTVSDAYYQNVWLNKPALNWNFDLLLYHVVDLNANAGLGKVTEKKKVLLQNTPMKKSQMAACRHANGKDWWLLKMAGDTNMVFTFLVQQDTILRYPNQYLPFALRGVNDVWGQMKFSKDGRKWATTYDAFNDTTYQHYGDVYVANFDRCTGQLSGFQQFIAPPYIDTGNGGLEFSPNGNFLYVTKYNAVQQLDLADGTWYTVSGPDTNAFCGYTTLELAPDDRIYIGRYQGTCKQWSVINSPDIKFNCDFCPNCLRSKSNWGYFGRPPNMPNYELGATGQPCWPLQNEQVNQKEKELLVFPNPASGQLYIQTEIKGERMFFNALGQLVQRTKGNELDVSALPAGVYWLRVGNRVKKVVVE
jgi:hypothetical protein